MNAHVPDQLGQLSKKELLEVAQIMHETNVDLNAQLAKANERVKELEGQLELTMLTTHEKSFERDYGKRALNKFAIEKKSEAFNAVKNEIKTVGGLELCDVVEFVDEQIEQLRKEQDNV